MRGHGSTIAHVIAALVMLGIALGLGACGGPRCLEREPDDWRWINFELVHVQGACLEWDAR